MTGSRYWGIMRRFCLLLVAVMAVAGCSSQTSTDSAREGVTSLTPTVQAHESTPIEECVATVKVKLISRWDMFVNGADPERDQELQSWVAMGGWDDPAVAAYINFADAGRAELLQGKTIMGLLAEKEPQIHQECSEGIAQQQ
ncbi:hypothetical protein [Streptomyces wuyuanensis]|uniref:hypothetical protein n=1 Tax=Streptomyces wuyuanensis TaxID=1196353 RepID=UPI0036935216